MKYIVFIICFLLSGCYLANGSPSESTFWIKNQLRISKIDNKKCQKIVLDSYFPIKDKERLIYLDEKSQKIGQIEFMKNKSEYEEYSILLERGFSLMRKCYYDLGYRFKAPLYWCLAQDGDNTKVCMENMKYRN
ncbi:hypothetical protein [Gallibacterium sp. AGMB14963]|uniref:hypothetical protein n=1 Tax=Gallibacterium faecale TaxID=3019086 RepID=UPI0022F151A0|nr:hypothetical protein [Gallibacterium sp. AGMB14963]MDA3977540.1 hypothetical protein [Gallibacterium sp. AGMB14963]